MDNISQNIEKIKKQFASPDSKLDKNADIIHKIKVLKQFVENGFQHIVKEETDIPFMTLKELEQRIIDERKAEFKRIFRK